MYDKAGVEVWSVSFVRIMDKRWGVGGYGNEARVRLIYTSQNSKLPLSGLIVVTTKAGIMKGLLTTYCDHLYPLRESKRSSEYMYQ